MDGFIVKVLEGQGDRHATTPVTASTYQLEWSFSWWAAEVEVPAECVLRELCVELGNRRSGSSRSAPF